MKSLEDRVAPFIIKMNQGASFQFSSGEVESLGTWAFKTLALYNINSNYRHLIDRDSLQFLYREQKPAPGYVLQCAFAPAASNDSLRTRQSNIQFFLVPSSFDARTFNNLVEKTSCVIALQVGRVFFQLIGFPRAKWELVQTPGYVRQLWPDPTQFAWPPKEGLIAEEGESIDGLIDKLHVSPSIRVFEWL